MPRLVTFGPSTGINKMKTVKLQLVLCSDLVAGFPASCGTEKESQLKAKAKISQADAQAIALTKVPNRTVKECELEREHGKLIWSCDFTTPDSKDITELNVDALTGAVVNVEHQKAEKQGAAIELLPDRCAGLAAMEPPFCLN
jgi:Peptidase propeptide and YPEB domain